MKALWLLLEGRNGEFLRLLAVSSLVSAAEALLHPLMLKWLFDEAVVTQDFRRFWLLGLAYLAAGLGLIALFWAVSLWQKAFVNRVVLEVEGRLLKKVLHLDWRDFSREGAGAFVSRVHQDVLEGLAPAVSLLVAVARQALAALTFLGVLLYLSWQATLALAILVPPLLWVAQRVGTRVRRAAENEREAEARYLEVLSQSLKAFRALRGIPRLVPPTLATNQEALGAYLDGTYRSQRLVQAQQSWSDVFMNLANTLALVVGGYFVLSRALSFGGYLAFVNAFWRAVDNTFSLLRRAPEFHRHAQVLERVHGLLSSAPAPYVRTAAEAWLQGVRVAYAGGALLELPRLQIRPGERLLLVGSNGTGKTTLLHVLAGYLAPQEGEVELPGRVAALTAPPELPPLTVRELVPDAGLRRELGLEGLEDHRPEALSSGQRQKAAIGALLCQEADLYLLDEPLANLDTQSREGVLDLILRRTAGKALVVVLHGDEALHRRFDRVVELAGPRVLTPGSDHSVGN